MSKETWELGTLSRILPESLQYPTDPCVWDTLCMLTKQELVYFFSSCFKMSSSQNFWVMHWVFILCKCYYKELVWVILTVCEILDITKYFAKCTFFLHKFISRQLFIPPKNFYTISGSSYCSYSYWTETKLVALTFFLPVLSSYWTSG